MGRIELRHSEFPVPLGTEGHLMGPYGYLSAQKGCPTWFRVDITSVEKYQDIILEASFRYKPSETNPHEHRHKSRIGIWTAVKDSPSLVDVASRNDEYTHGESKDFKLLLDEWRFGQDAQIAFHLNKTSLHSTIKLALCSVPFFHATEGKNASTQVHLSLSGMMKGDLHYTLVDEKIVTFNRDDDARKIQPRTEINLFKEFGALEIGGEGNSIHPKQLYTARALSQELSDNDAETVDIAYIGTDTTENLRSIIRRFKHDSIFSKVSNLTVYFKEGWDTALMEKFPNLELTEDLGGQKFSLKFIKLPKDGTIPEETIPVDYILSTYVTPWAMELDDDGKKTNREQYIELIHSLLGKEKSRLISVDPQDSSKAIRASCDVTNLQNLYLKDLDLKLHDSVDSGEDMVVDCKIWKRKNKVVE
jgi:hypothetical protein